MTKEILNSLCNTAQVIASMFGNNCETIVHDFSNNEPKVVAIYNGHVTGRTANSTASVYGLDVVNLMDIKDVHNSRVINNQGHIIKASSVIFSGEGYRYVLGINYDVTALSLVQSQMESIMQFADDFDISSFSMQAFSSIIDNCLAELGKSADRLNKAERMAIVQTLDEHDMFSVQKAVPTVSERLGVSRYTIYNYLNVIREKRPELLAGQKLPKLK